jgi:hypothetical protein
MAGLEALAEMREANRDASPNWRIAGVLSVAGIRGLKVA